MIVSRAVKNIMDGQTMIHDLLLIDFSGKRLFSGGR